MKTAQRFLTVADVAGQLGVNLGKVIGWIDRGELTAVNVAARRGIGCRPRWRIAEEALDLFLRQRESTPAPKAARSRRTEGGEVFFRGRRPVA